MKTTNLINELKEHLELVINGLLDEQDTKELEDDVYFMLGNLESMSESAHRIDWTLNK